MMSAEEEQDRKMERGEKSEKEGKGKKEEGICNNSRRSSEE